MSRSGYTDDCENLELYRANVDRSIQGKRGQAFLRELAEAMDSMDEKILIHGDLIDAEGACCAIGVVCKSRHLDVQGVDVECPTSVAQLVGIARCMAAEIEFVNDEEGYASETPEERWIRVRKWVSRQLEVA